MSETSERSLQVGDRSPQRAHKIVTALAVAASAVALLVWFVNSPADLPLSDADINAATAVDRPVFVGMIATHVDLDRTLRLSGVKVRTTSNTQIEVTPLLCRGGAVNVTTDPDLFCDELVNPEGRPLRPQDDVVLRIESGEPAIAVVDRIRVGFREGVQVGTLPIGARSAVIRVAAR